jgi:hypothetical protein
VQTGQVKEKNMDTQHISKHCLNLNEVAIPALKILPVRNAEYLTLEEIELYVNADNQVERRILSSIAQKNPEMRVTFYQRIAKSSTYLGVAGPISILEEMQEELKRLLGIQSHICDFPAGDLAESSCPVTMEYHIEHGKLWMSEDRKIWSVFEPESTTLEQDDDLEYVDLDEESDDEDEESETLLTLFDQDPVTMEAPLVQNDDRIGSIRRKIESVFNLPEGSVLLCRPDGNALHPNEKIATLRRRWAAWSQE